MEETVIIFKCKHISFFTAAGLLIFANMNAIGEPVYNPYSKNIRNDSANSYRISLNRYDYALVGTMKISSVAFNEESADEKVHFIGEFIIRSAVKGQVPFGVLKFEGAGSKGCISKVKRVDMFRMLEGAVKNGGDAEVLKLINETNKEQKSEDCFYAVHKEFSYWDNVYKSRYEFIFENHEYIIFTDKNNISKDGFLEFYNADISAYDSLTMKK